MADEKSGGGAGGGFPTTRRSAVAGVASTDASVRERSLETLAAAYWKPVYKYVRVRWSRSADESQDLTQEFFARALEKDYFAAYVPSKGRFRTFLRVCVDRFVANRDRDAGRLKRGGGVRISPLEFESAEGELKGAEIPASDSVERYFDAEWVRSLFALGVEALRAECEARGRRIHFEIFEKHDLDPPPDGAPTYAELAGELGIPVTQVTNHLAFARREFRRLLLDKLREITVNDEEFRLEARFLLGARGE